MLVFACTLSLLMVPRHAAAQRSDAADGTPPASQTPAPPNKTPSQPQVIEILPASHITGAVPPIPRSTASRTVIGAPLIGRQDPDLTLPNIIARSVPGASINPDNGLRIRGADDQFSTYLDGVPVPQSITGSITDTFDPKDIQSLRVYTGGYPAEYGNQLAGVFDIQTKAQTGRPSGVISQSAGSFDAYDTYGSIGGGDNTLGYFASASRRQTNFFLNPPTQTNNDNQGHEDHLFAKVGYAAGSADRVSLQLGANGSNFQTPDTSDTQQETGTLANLVWAHRHGIAVSRLSLYTRRSSLRYNGNPDDAEHEDGLLDTNQNQHTTDVGVRGDGKLAVTHTHLTGIGFDISRATSDQDFVIHLPAPGGTLSDTSAPHSWNVGLYAQDDWTPGRLLIDYGVRFDRNSQDVTTNQVSPRLNIRYSLTSRDMLHVFYDRLFQPIPVEDATHLVGQATVGDNGTLAALRPECDDLYEVGYDHTEAHFAAGIAAYYKAGRDVRDDDEVGNTNILLPVNDAKAYFRGVELTLSRTFSPTLLSYVNFALSWNKNAGPVTGGLNEGGFPTAYFYDDHDQTRTSTFGLSYTHRSFLADFVGEYGSGQPYGEIDDENGNATAVNYLRVPPHVTLNLDAGTRVDRSRTISLFADNLLNHGYILKQITDLSSAQWAQGRLIGVRLNQVF